MIDHPFGEPAIERRDRLSRDALIGSAEQPEHRCSDVVDAVERCGRVVPPRSLERPVHPDDPGESEPERRGQE